MRIALVLLLSGAANAAAEASPASPAEIDRVAAFARLYGVVRFFHPSDAAAETDWDRFAVHGVSRVRAAGNAKELESALRSLVAPLGPGIEIGAKRPGAAAAAASGTGALVAWQYLGPGLTASERSAYRAQRTGRAGTTAAAGAPVGTAQALPADDLRGRPIRLRGYARAGQATPTGGAALWLRVDRPDRAHGFFDNMSGRPVRDTDWRECLIEGTVDADAARIVLGTVVFGDGSADFDGLELAVGDGQGGWTPVPLKDAGFEAETGAGAWTPINTTANITRPSEGAREGHRFLRLAPPDAEGGLFAALPSAGARADLELGRKLFASVPLTLTDAQARTDESRQAALEALKRALASADEAGSDRDRLDVRLADVVVAWNVFRHFYPYWTEAGVDWDARLRPLLEAAAAASTRTGHRDALRALAAELGDGHARVSEKAPEKEGRLPLAFAVVEDKLVVTASESAEVPVGAVVLAVDGAPAAERLATEMRLVSGSGQWKRARAASVLTSGAAGTSAVLRIDDGGAAREVTLPCEAPPKPVREKRPEPVAELSPGVWYVDLTRAKLPEVEAALARMESSAVVFDVRGYPTDAGHGILPHLMDTTETDEWMHIAKIVGPFGQQAGWKSTSWYVTPRTPRLRGRIVFLTDGRAISYAESVMGYVRDHKLATIVGGPTAGANGNVVSFEVPGGFTLRFTGMRVTDHEGRAALHLAGVKPDVAAAPTIAGLRAGRDEVLERALEVLRTP